MKRAIFRCEASTQIGTGHVVRCITLANALKEHGWSCLMATSKESGRTVPMLLAAGFPIVPPAEIDRQPSSDLIVIDGYQFNKAYETSLRAKTKKILVIDDLADKPHDCDLLIDQTYGRRKDDYAHLVPAGCILLTGAEYALLRPSFAGYRQESLGRRTGAIARILILLSGSDPDGVTLKALKAVTLLKNIPDTDVIIQSASPFYAQAQEICARHPAKIRLLENISNMAELMTRADLCIGAGGTANWERCCLGLPAIIMEISDNQKLIAASLSKDGAVVNLGWHQDLTPARIAMAIEALVNDPAQIRDMGAKSSEICDGLGTQRLVTAIKASFDL